MLLFSEFYIFFKKRAIHTFLRFERRSENQSLITEISKTTTTPKLKNAHSETVQLYKIYLELPHLHSEFHSIQNRQTGTNCGINKILTITYTIIHIFDGWGRAKAIKAVF